MYSLCTYFNPHGLGEPLDDGEEGVGGEHGRLVALGVDDLAERVGRGGQPPAHRHALQPSLAERATKCPDEAQHGCTSAKLDCIGYYMNHLIH